MAKSTEKPGTGERHEASEIGQVPPPPHDPPPPGVEEKTAGAAPTPHTADASFAAVTRGRYFVSLVNHRGAKKISAGIPGGPFNPEGKQITFIDGVAEIEEEDLEHFMDEARFQLHSR